MTQQLGNKIQGSQPGSRNNPYSKFREFIKRELLISGSIMTSWIAQNHSVITTVVKFAASKTGS